MADVSSLALGYSLRSKRKTPCALHTLLTALDAPSSIIAKTASKPPALGTLAKQNSFHVHGGVQKSSL